MNPMSMFVSYGMKLFEIYTGDNTHTVEYYELSSPIYIKSGLSFVELIQGKLLDRKQMI